MLLSPLPISKELFSREKMQLKVFKIHSYEYTYTTQNFMTLSRSG
jgi:hypothetical protein